MKKLAVILVSLLVVFSLVFTLASCGKEKGEGKESASEEAAVQGAASLDGTVFEEESDSSNTYFFGDGTYSETYKGNTLNGNFVISEDGSVLTLTPEGATYNYVYGIERNEKGEIVRLTQYEGRNFSIKTPDSAPEAK